MEPKRDVGFLVGALLVMWVVEIVDLVLLGGSLYVHGIRPRSIGGLDGVVLAPFLHAGIVHLAYNSIPLVLFGFLVSLDGPRHLAITTLLDHLRRLRNQGFPRELLSSTGGGERRLQSLHSSFLFQLRGWRSMVAVGEPPRSRR